MNHLEAIQFRKQTLIAKSEIYRNTIAIDIYRINTSALGLFYTSRWIRKLSPAIVGAGMITLFLFGKKFPLLRSLARKLSWIPIALRLINQMLKSDSYSSLR